MKPQINGALLVDKPAGVTSHDVVDSIRHIFKIKSVGHAGTLDPIATGLLICLLGEATKLSQYVMSEEKCYRVTVKFGVRTDTGDVSGKTIETREISPDKLETLNKAVAELVGELDLPVPMYSAVKIEGRKLYEYARSGEAIEVPTKKMTIRSATVVEANLPHTAVIDLHCEKGTYVRSWVEKLGERLGTVATVESLRRLSSGPFNVDHGVKVDELRAAGPGAVDKLIPMGDVLGGWPGLRVMGREEVLVKNGQIPRSIFGQLISIGGGKGARILDEKGGLLALVTSDGRAGVKIARVFGVPSKS